LVLFYFVNFFGEDVLKFLVVAFAIPIAQVIFFLQFETFYTCVTYLYLPYNMYRVDDEIFYLVERANVCHLPLPGF
jgi:hypothetical protein